jgi:hypothetical protein
MSSIIHDFVSLQRGFFILCLYLLVACGLTFNLLIVGNTALVGNQYVGSLGLWATWWPVHAFATNQSLGFTDYFLFPIQTNVFPLLSLLLTFVYFFLSRVFQPFLSYHLTLLICLWLNAISGYYFLRRKPVGEFDIYAFYGGLVIAFNPLTWVLASQGEFSLLAIFPLLWALINWGRLLKQPNLGNTILLVLSLYVTILTSIQFWNLLLTFFLVYAIWTMPKKGTALFNWLLLAGLALLGAVAIYPLSNLLWSTYVPLYPSLDVWQGMTDFNTLIWIVFAGLAIVVRLVTIWIPESWTSTTRFWIGIIVLHIVLYAAPQFAPLSLLGIPRLFVLTRSIIFLFPIVIATIIILTDSLRLYKFPIQLPSYKQVILSVLGVIFLSGWLLPLPRTSLPDTSLYALIGQDPENYTIIDFPIGVDSLARQRSLEVQPNEYPTLGIEYRAGLTLAYMPWHEKRVVGGLANTLTNQDLEVYRNSALAQIAAFLTPSTDLFTTAKTLREEFLSWRVGYIVIHPEDGDPTWLRQWLVWTGTFCEVAHLDDTQLWRNRWHPDGCPDYKIDIGSANDKMALASGWYASEEWPEESVRWGGPEKRATFSFWVEPSRSYRLHIRATAPSVPNQQVEVWANRQRIGQFSPGSNWEEYVLTLPREIIQTSGLVKVEFRHSEINTESGRSLTAAYDYVILSPMEEE